MANQHAMTLEAIMSIKKAAARERDRASDLFDDDVPRITNHGNKLKRRAEYYHEGEMGGRMPVKRKIEHAGYTRHILRQNPKRFDEDGFELLSDEEDEEADREAAEKNPYSGIYIEQLLRPLTHASDLQIHPAMSLHYKSEVLPNIVRETLGMVHKERNMLVEAKLLLGQLRGDAPWVPAGDFIHSDDITMFMNEKQQDGTYAAPPMFPFETGTPTHPKTDLAEHGLQESDAVAPDHNGDLVEKDLSLQPKSNIEKQEQGATSTVSGDQINGAGKDANGATVPVPDQEPAKQDDAHMTDASSEAVKHTEQTEQHPSTNIEDNLTEKVNGGAAEVSEEQTATAVPDGADPNVAELSKSSNPPTPSAISSPGSSPPARMQTRAQTNAANGTPHLATLSRSTSPVPQRPESPVTLHPLYLLASSALPDRNIGLPMNEAEDLRRLLSAYVQKQEEVCRRADCLYQDLLKALRLRDTIWWWCRAEPHRGEMSDGEDWVDKEEWGLDEDLRKGDAITEEPAEEHGKKTRGRRAAG